LRKPNPECAVCSKVSVRVEVDRNKATLGNLVDDILRTKLGYGEELAVQHGDNLLYDPDFDESLSKTFVDLNIEADDLLTIVDQEDDNPRVDLALSIVQTYVNMFRLISTRF
jgi:ubiquitin-like 1-activating enzyme E1 B